MLRLGLTETRDILFKLPERLLHHRDALALTKNGRPVMALMSWELYESLMETLEAAGDAGVAETLGKVEDIDAQCKSLETIRKSA
jgi:PHD/YefM family antitoxin component YafN of YafNO toxin-antitoxin module